MAPIGNGKILVVDDDIDMRESLADVLVDAGYDADTVVDGFAALRYLRANPLPSLVLLDWMMPGCNGAQFRQAQTADPEIADVPVVMLTADARIRDELTLVGTTRYLAKPVMLDELLAVVAAYCRQHVSQVSAG